MSEVMPMRSYGGESATDRTQARRARLLESGRVVIRRDGLHRTTYRAVLAESGLTGRYFYESFPNLEALVAELMAELVALAPREVLARLDPADTVPAQARAGIRAFVELLDRDRLYAELVLAEAPDLPGLARMRQTGLAAFGEFAFAQASGRLRRPGSEHEERRARHAITLLNGGFFEVLRERAAGRLLLDVDEVVDFTADLFVNAADHLTAGS